MSKNLKPVGIHIRKEITFGPNNAMDSLARSASDGANWITLGSFFGVAIVTFGFTLLTLSFWQ